MNNGFGWLLWGNKPPQQKQNASFGELVAQVAFQEPLPKVDWDAEGLTLPQPSAPPPPPPPSVPFMAVAATQKGEPVYGAPPQGNVFLQMLTATGFQNWVRGVVGRIFDPQKTTEGLSDKEKEALPAWEERYKEIYNDFLLWDKIAAPILGISAEEMAKAQAPFAAETSLGDYFAAMLGAGKRMLGEEIKAGLGLFGIGDYLVRIGKGTALSLEQMLDEKKLESAGTVNVLETMAFTHPTASISRAVRMWGALLGGDITLRDIPEAAIRGMYASRAAYALFYDPALRVEFFRRYEAGENPELLLAEAQEKHPWVEFAGSVVLDPTTYMGLGLAKPVKAGTAGARYLTFFGRELKFLGKNWKTVAYIPEFGELFNIGLGKGRILKDAMAQTEVVEGLRPFFRAGADAKNDADAAKAVASALDEARKFLHGKPYSAVSYVSTSKARLAYKDARQTIEALEMLPITAREKLAAMRNAVALAIGNDAEKARAFIELSNLPNPGVFLSKRGMRTVAILEEIAKNGEIEKIIDGKIDAGWLERITDVFEKTTERMYPSVREMALAASGKMKGERAEELAAAYKRLPWWVKASNTVAEAYEKAGYRAIRGYMGTTFIALSGKQPPRNINGQTFPSIAMLGIGKGIEVALRSFAAFFGKRAVDAQTLGAARDVEKMLGVVPERLAAGIGSEAKAIAFAKVSQRAEQIASAEIMRTGIRKVMEMAVEKTAPSASELMRLGLSEEQAALLSRLYYDEWGNAERVFNEFNRLVGGEEIETWRFVRPSPRLTDFLERYRTAEGFTLREAIETALKESETPETFRARVYAIMDATREAAENVLREEAYGVDSGAPRQMLGALTDVEGAKAEGFVTQGEAEAFESVVKAWRAVDREIERVKNVVLSHFSRALDPDAAARLVDQVNEIEASWMATLDVVDAIRRETLDAVRRIRGGDNPTEVWYALRSGGYSLAEMFPNVSPNQLTKSEIIAFIWNGYFEAASRTYYGANLKRYTDIVSAFGGAAKAMPSETSFIMAGKKVNAAGLLKQATEQIQKSVNLAKEWEDALYLERLHYNRAKYSFARVARAYGVPTASEKGRPIKSALNIVNEYAAQKGMDAFKSGDDVPYEFAIEAFENWKKLRKPVQAYVEGTRPSMARALYESFDGVMNDIETFVKKVEDKWGETTYTSALDAQKNKAVQDLLAAAEKKLAPMRAVAARYGENLRDFILHDYEKTYLDAAYAYLVPFHYWSTRTYMRGVEIALQNPRWAHWYAEYKEALAREHAGLPDFWKQNIEIARLPGLSDSPIFLNLEASLNPYYNLLGADFTDPRRRVDWITRMMEDLQGIGISPLPLVNWAVAYHLWKKGEQDAANRWLGRFFPQSQAIKAALYLADVNLPETPVTRHNEIDPFVNLFMGGVDPYERARVGRSAAARQIRGEVGVNETMDAVILQEGDAWEEAIKTAIDERAKFQILSEFAGVGFKARRPEDVYVDLFYRDLSALYAARDRMSAEEYRKARTALMEKYPFGDAVLISKKDGAERDAAIAYHVLSRIPPGMQSDVLSVVGLTNEDIERFYNDKGDMSGWKKQDRDAFMAGILRLSVSVSIPENAVREEWDAAREQYEMMKDEIEKRLKVKNSAEFWRLYYSAPGDSAERNKFYEEHPEVLEAYRLTNAYKAANPLLAAYYGGVDALERYMSQKLRDTMKEKYGDDIYEKYYAYLNTLDKKERKKMANSDPALRGFLNDETRKKWEDEINRQVAEFAATLPEAKTMELRGETPISAALRQAMTPQVNGSEILASMPPEVQEMVSLYASGAKLPYEAYDYLQYAAMHFRVGSVDELLRILLEEIYRQQQNVVK